MTQQERQKGLDFVIWLAAFISINLGLLNLLPIPSLDGGQVAILFIEGAIRRRLPPRIRDVAQVIGIALIVLIMGIAPRNDLRRSRGTADPVARELG